MLELQLKSLLDLEDLGPKVVIVDDSSEDGVPLKEAFNNLNVRNQFFQVDFSNPDFPAEPLMDVRLIFMDLYFNEGFGAPFDPDLCIQWLEKILPPGQKYVLVVWSRDAYVGAELLDAMKGSGIPMPYYFERRTKSNYRMIGNKYDAERLLKDLERGLEQNVQVEKLQFYGRILEIDQEDDSLLINCLMQEQPKRIFEVRRFALLPLRHIIPLNPGVFLRIDITTKPGSTNIEFTPESADLSNLFIKPDPQDFGDIAWLNTPEE
ncbi:MAG TPA: hypothetical protein VGQ53_16300 [Chitinophagaceae bacterium]|jgi:hypothetical protein|nr:hypothetical protein [Chitinophagaceae bacterium]